MTLLQFMSMKKISVQLLEAELFIFIVCVFFLLLSLKLVSVSQVKSDMAWSCSTTWECINFLSAHVVLWS